MHVTSWMGSVMTGAAAVRQLASLGLTSSALWATALMYFSIFALSGSCAVGISGASDGMAFVGRSEVTCDWSCSMV